ncbi:MAG: sulfite exporter TauE/SafE family protein [Thermodesulfobacteriota bacterium]
MFFPVAQIEVAPWLPPVIALIISFFTSMGGVSGAFLLLPFQVSVLGYTSPSVSATNQLFNIVAIPSGVYRYWKEGRMVWPLTWIVILGTLPGVLIGAVVRVTWLPDPRHFKLFAAAVLLYIGIRMARDLLKRKGDTSPSEATGSGAEAGGSSALQVTRFDAKRLEYSFRGESFGAPFWGVFAVSFIVGIVGGIYGIGGGSIIAPFFVTFFRLPVYTIAGAALMGTFVTSVAGVAFYQAIAPFYPGMSIAPDWLLGILFGLGGMAGMYLGARCQRFVPAKVIKWMLTAVLLFTAAQYVAGFFLV